MRVVIALFVGLVIGGGAVWFLSTSRGKSAVHSTADQIESSTKAAHDSIQERLRAWELRPEEVKEDLAKTGEVIRDRARQATQALADSTADARITAAIKRKLL